MDHYAGTFIVSKTTVLDSYMMALETYNKTIAVAVADM